MILAGLSGSVRIFASLALTLVIGGCASFPSKPSTEADAKTPNEMTLEAQQYERVGDEVYASGDLETALVQYFLALENKSDNPGLFAKIGTVYRQQNNFASAERSFKQALNIDPSHLVSREGIGLVNLARNRLKVAQLMLESVVNSQENRWQSLSALGVIHDLQAEYDTAQGYYLKALRIVPASAKLMNNLGYSYYLEGDLPKAEEQFKKVVETYPDYSQSWSNLALIYMQRNEIARAKLAFEKNVSEHQALNNIGYIELLNNKTESARKTFEAAIKLSPTFYPVAQQNIASLDTRVEPVKPDPVTQVSSLETKTDSTDTSARIAVAAAKPVPEKPVVPDAVPSVDVSSKTVTSVTTHATRSNNVRQQSGRPAINRENVLYVQEKLMSYGFNPGPLDGKLGRKTIRAIRRFQRANNMPVTGRLSRTLMNRF